MNFEIIKNAAEYVRQLGREDGNEHLCGVDANGNIMFVCHGETHSVSAEGYPVEDMAYIVHNHPSGASLSVQDIAMSTLQKNTCVAVSPTGSLYATSGVNTEWVVKASNKAKLMDEEDRKILGLDSLQHLEKAIGVSLFVERMTGDFHGEPDHYASHFTNMIAREEGLLNYEFQLSPQDKAMYDRQTSFFHKRSGMKIDLT